MPPTTRTPRQQIFTELEKLLQRVRVALNKESDDQTFEDLDAILFLARATAEAIRNYMVRRDLLVEIYAALVEQPVDLTKLDTNWDGEGTIPSLELHRHLSAIATAVASRLPIDESPINNPFDGERITCAELRSAFGDRSRSLGVPHAAQAFATA